MKYFKLVGGPFDGKYFPAEVDDHGIPPEYLSLAMPVEIMERFTDAPLTPVDKRENYKRVFFHKPGYAAWHEYHHVSDERG